jgi:uncharacterized membrane protein
MDKLQGYRQPIVTTIGILMGFILNYSSNWAQNSSSKSRFNQLFIGISVITCITLLLVVLYRILDIHYPKETAEAYYHKTLLLFIFAISIPFAGIILVILKNFILNPP